MAKRWLHNLLSDRWGTSTIELAIIFPVLAALTFIAADLAMAFKAKIRLQAAAERTAQLATSGGLNSAAYQNLAADAAAGAGVSSNAVTVTSSLLCDGTVQASMAEVCATGQQMKRYVTIGITGSYQPMFGKLLPGTSWASAQGITLTGSSSVRLQ
jgi:Flp pilus assembly protein TadG